MIVFGGGCLNVSIEVHSLQPIDRGHRHHRPGRDNDRCCGRRRPDPYVLLGCLLLGSPLEFGALGPALQQLAGTTGPIEAAQSAVARYTRRGFEAAAITHYGIAASGRRPKPAGLYRSATLRFAHPHAVVAATQGHEPDSPWNGLPVFAAWITDPDDAQD